jgi:hypothetical protein
MRIGWRAAATLGVIAAVAGSCTAPRGHASPGPGSSTRSRTSASVLAPVHGPYAPSIDPANFVDGVDNPYWPLTPGTTFRYEGVRGHTPQTDVEVVTHRTKEILGVTSTVVRDTCSSTVRRSSEPSTGTPKTGRATSGTWARTRSN